MSSCDGTVSHTHLTAPDGGLVAVGFPAFGHDTGLANRMCQRGYDVVGKAGAFERDLVQIWARPFTSSSLGGSVAHGSVCLSDERDGLDRFSFLLFVTSCA